VAAGAGAALLFSLGNAPVAGAAPDTSLTDFLGAVTDQFGVYSDNITDNMAVSASADSAIYNDYLTAAPGVDNTAALDGLQEVSGQLNDQLTNANTEDFHGFQDVFAADLNDIYGDSAVPDPAVGDVLDAQTNQFAVFSDNITTNLQASAAGDNAIYTEYLGALPNVDNAAALNGLQEVSGQLNDQLSDANATDVSGFSDVLDADNNVANATPTPTDPALSGVLGAQTDQFTAFSNNITGNVLQAGNGDVGIYGHYLGALPNVDNGAALDGLQEVSGQLNDQLSNANAFDLSGFDSVLGADFTNLGDFLGL
jgi:predicted transglutaminase-like cysteine proteinase